MSDPIVRKYVYQSTFDEVMSWGKLAELKAPNNKDNFPYFLEKYIQEVERIKRDYQNDRKQ